MEQEIDKYDPHNGTHCFYCKREYKVSVSIYFKPNTPLKRTVDHIIPVCVGGTDDIENLVGSCNDCNLLKGDMSIRRFGRYVRFLRNSNPNHPILILFEEISRCAYRMIKRKEKLIICPTNQN